MIPVILLPTKTKVTAFYTAQLTAVLTTQERHLPVSTLEELQVRDCFSSNQDVLRMNLFSPPG